MLCCLRNNSIFVKICFVFPHYNRHDVIHTFFVYTKSYFPLKVIIIFIFLEFEKIDFFVKIIFEAILSSCTVSGNSFACKIRHFELILNIFQIFEGLQKNRVFDTNLYDVMCLFFLQQINML